MHACAHRVALSLSAVRCSRAVNSLVREIVLCLSVSARAPVFLLAEKCLGLRVPARVRPSCSSCSRGHPLRSHPLAYFSPAGGGTGARGGQRAVHDGAQHVGLWRGGRERRAGRHAGAVQQQHRPPSGVRSHCACTRAAPQSNRHDYLVCGAALCPFLSLLLFAVSAVGSYLSLAAAESFTCKAKTSHSFAAQFPVGGYLTLAAVVFALTSYRIVVFL